MLDKLIDEYHYPLDLLAVEYAVSFGTEIDYYERLNPNYFEPLSDIPKASETIDDVKNKVFTYLELMQKDRLAIERKSLKNSLKK